jgi:Fic family protein
MTYHSINSLTAQIKSLPPITVENQRKLDMKFRLEFNFNSNHIEGNTLTFGETKLLLIFDKTEGVHEMREFEEMKAHDVAYKIILDWAKDASQPLTQTDIKQLNEIILVRPFWKEATTPDGQNTRRLIKAGAYKEQPNSVRLQNGEMFHYASPTDTSIKMGELIDWYNTEIEKNELHPIELAALFHYKFVLIHPFDDGNGRISRLLMNYVLLKNNLPPVIIKTNDKKNYLNALNQADTGNINAFIQYIAKQLEWSLELQIKATKGESIEEPLDVEKEISLYKKYLNSGTKPNNFLKPSLEYFDGLKRLNQYFQDKIKENFYDLFENNTQSFYAGTKPQFSISIPNVRNMDNLEIFLKSNNHNNWTSRNYIGLGNFKYSNEIPYITVNLLIEYKKLAYSIYYFFDNHEHTKKLLFENNSNYILTDEDIQNTVAPILKDIFSKIKQ